MIKISILYIV